MATFGSRSVAPGGPVEAGRRRRCRLGAEGRASSDPGCNGLVADAGGAGRPCPAARRRERPGRVRGCRRRRAENGGVGAPPPAGPRAAGVQPRHRRGPLLTERNRRAPLLATSHERTTPVRSFLAMQEPRALRGAGLCIGPCRVCGLRWRQGVYEKNSTLNCSHRF